MGDAGLPITQLLRYFMTAISCGMVRPGLPPAIAAPTPEDTLYSCVANAADDEICSAGLLRGMTS